MSLEPLRYRRLECAVCGRADFEDIDQFRGHVDWNSMESCPGGTPD